MDELLSLLLGSLLEVLNELPSVPFELSDTLAELLDDASLSESLESVLTSELLFETPPDDSIAVLLESLPLDALDASPAPPFEGPDSLVESFDEGGSFPEALEFPPPAESLRLDEDDSLCDSPETVFTEESPSLPLGSLLKVLDELPSAAFELPDTLAELLDDASLSESPELIVASEPLLATLLEESLPVPLEAFSGDVLDELSASLFELPDSLAVSLEDGDALSDALEPTLPADSPPKTLPLEEVSVESFVPTLEPLPSAVPDEIASAPLEFPESLAEPLDEDDSL